MNTIWKMVRMDMAICRKAMLIMYFGMVIFGIGCLFFLTPLFLSFFVIGSTALVSAIFSVESKSNMDFFYGCLPIRKWERVVGRGITCFIVLAIPSVICMVFTQIDAHFSLCKVEEVRLMLQMTQAYQTTMIAAMIMLGFVGGANLLLASFIGKIESREMMEVLFLLVEGLVVGIIVFGVGKIWFHGDNRAFLMSMERVFSEHKVLSNVALIGSGIVFLMVCTLLCTKLVGKKCAK